MRFMERTIMGLRYHRKMNILIAALTAVYSIIGLFLRTNAANTTSNATNFSQRIAELPGSNTSGVTSVVLRAHSTQADYYNIAFAAATLIYLILLIVIAAIFVRRQQAETAAYIGAGKQPFDIASQTALEGGISATVGFTIVSVIVSLFSATVSHWWAKANQFIFAHAIGQPRGTQHQEMLQGIKTMMSKRMTDFNPQSLLFGDSGMSSQIPNTVVGFATVGVAAISAVVIVNLIVMMAQARTVRSHLN